MFDCKCSWDSTAVFQSSLSVCLKPLMGLADDSGGQCLLKLFSTTPSCSHQINSLKKSKAVGENNFLAASFLQYIRRLKKKEKKPQNKWTTNKTEPSLSKTCTNQTCN